MGSLRRRKSLVFLSFAFPCHLSRIKTPELPKAAIRMQLDAEQLILSDSAIHIHVNGATAEDHDEWV